MSDWHEDVLRHKYDPLPEEPRFKKKRKKRHVKSDHRHEYEQVCIDAHSISYTRDGTFAMYHLGLRCRACGKLGSVRCWQWKGEPPSDLPMYEIDDVIQLIGMKYLTDDMRVDSRTS